MAKEKYYLGLDIGTNSVGFCVTDQDYNIVTKRAVRHGRNGQKVYTKKHLWGARLFEEASTAAERRQHRTARRRLQRRRWRLDLLQEIFREEMDKVDPRFFERLNSSFFHDEDKAENIWGLSLLFANREQEKRFRKDYPTIYHLRQKMLKEPDRRFDLREVYLVLAHMIKYRGNFLTEGDLQGTNTSPEALKRDFDELDAILEELPLDESFPIATFHLTLEQARKIGEAFQTIVGTSKLKEALSNICPIAKNKDEYDIRQSILDMIRGSGVKLTSLFPDEREDEEKDAIKICFEGDFEEKAEEILGLVNDVQGRLILKAKEIRDARVLSQLLKKNATLTDAMIALYDEHKRELRFLKHLYRAYRPEDYENMFKTIEVKKKDGKAEAAKNYVNYVAYNGKKGGPLRHSTTQDELCKKILNDFKDRVESFSADDRKVWDEVLPLLEINKFLPKQNSKDNSVIPYQFNYNEMKTILDHQKKFYPFLGAMDKDFLHPEKDCYKILSLLSFRVPYYVGPLPSQKTSSSWHVRKVEGVKITPWNFYDIVDEKESANRFISRMTNACTYLYGEPTLPRNSLLYSLFILLNEMNNWLLNGAKLSREDKECLIREVYLCFRKPELRQCREALLRRHNAKDLSEIVLSTKTGKELLEEDMHADLASFIDLEKILQKDLLRDKKAFDLGEEIIAALTVFEDSRMKKERLKELGLPSPLVQRLSHLSFKGWGRMSRKLLNELRSPAVDPETGEDLEKDMTILELMWEFPLSFQEIYESKDVFTFKKQVERENQEYLEKNKEEDFIDSLYCSPAIKRSLRQTEKIVEELKKILKIDSFSAYFLECTRDDQKRKDAAGKKRTVSRKKMLQDVYRACHIAKEEEHLCQELESTDEEALRKDKLFLYFLQLGKDVYSGKPIPLTELKDYDIDHIIPQAMLKDDSLDNRVLVAKETNIKKQDIYPIPKGLITEEGRKQIDALYARKDAKGRPYLMSKVKYERLTTPAGKTLTDEERAGFINRQLTITSQSVKATADLLHRIDPNGKVVYSRASTVSDFRKAFDLVKCRDVNDFHHAHDAYLNIVVGNVYDKVFSGSVDVERLREIREHYEGTKIDPKNFFRHDQHQIIPGTHLTGAEVWKAKRYDDNKQEIPSSEGTIDRVRTNLQLHDPMVTIMTHRQKGLFGKTSFHSTRDNAVLPLKQTPVLAQEGFARKYGGYNDLTGESFLLVRSEGKKGKHSYTLESFPAIYGSKRGDAEFLHRFLTTDDLGPKLRNPEVLLPFVPIKAVLEIPGKNGSVRIAINGKTGERFLACNITELWLPEEYVRYVQRISILFGNNLPAGTKRPDTTKYDNCEEIDVHGRKITKEDNRKLFDYLCDTVFQKTCFHDVPGLQNTIDNVIERRDLFDNLSTLDQAFVLNELIKVLQNNNSKADLRKIGLSKLSGNITYSKQFSPSLRILAQSVTGFYEKILFTIPED